ncbi:uncharacterized protein FFFS_15917 [Fusarium fujikuroi]|nr:uncharacterized protein FFFS_15917 [Fusarium fujikuroi]
MSSTREVFSQHPNQTHVHNSTNRAVVTPQAALAYRRTLKDDRSCERISEHYGTATKWIHVQDFHRLSSKFLIQIALFDCETVIRMVARFPIGVITASGERRRHCYDVKCLAGAMKYLKHCRKINISTSIHAWEMWWLRQRIGILPQRGLTFKSKASIRQVHHIVQDVLEAIAVSGISVQYLDIEPSTMIENANRISPFILMGPSSSTILSRSFPTSLRQLQISLDLESPPDDKISGRKWGLGLLQFIHLLPELSDLELSFEHRHEIGRFS